MYRVILEGGTTWPSAHHKYRYVVKTNRILFPRGACRRMGKSWPTRLRQRWTRASNLLFHRLVLMY
jgi:hypothetical protein